MDAIEKECKALEAKQKNQQQNIHQQLALPVPTMTNPEIPIIQPPVVHSAPIVVENHALDPANKNILPLESALVLFNQATEPNKEMTNNAVPKFDLLSMLNDLDDDDDITNQQMVVAATQIEQNFKQAGIMKITKIQYCNKHSKTIWLSER